jgi:hypothetical protein
MYNLGTPTDLTGHAGLTNWWRGGDNNGGAGTTMSDAVGGYDLDLLNAASFVADVP